MTDTWEDDYKAKLRTFMEQHGAAVEFDTRWATETVSPYDWRDAKKNEHATSDKWYEAPCRWVVPVGAQLKEREYSKFEGTFTDNKDEVGVNVYGCRCACGKYEDVTLRWIGSLGAILQEILNLPKGEIQL